MLFAAMVASSCASLAGCGDFQGSTTSGEGLAGGPMAGQPSPVAPPNEAKSRPDSTDRPNSVVRIQGEVDRIFVKDLADGFRALPHPRPSGTELRSRSSAPGAAFAALCTGEADIVTSSRQINGEESARCGADGLATSDFKLALDALAVVVRRGARIGTNCLNFSQLSRIFQRNAQIKSWGQVEADFSSLPLTTSGPTDGQADFDFFFSRVLGTPRPTLTDIRADYADDPLGSVVRKRVLQRPAGALGVVGFGSFGSSFRALDVDDGQGSGCVPASGPQIGSESYPLSRPVRAYVTPRGLARPRVRSVLRHHLRRAASTATQYRLVPLADPLRGKQLESLKVASDEADAAVGG